jgi:hypothetical protein
MRCASTLLQMYGLVDWGIRYWHSCISVRICGAFGSTLLCRSNTGRGSSGWSRSMVGSGHCCTPRECMQAANLTIPPSAAWTSVWVDLGGFVFGSRCWQAVWATPNWGLPARGTTSFLGISPLLLGSGKLETPWVRMQREKASAPPARADAAEVAEEGPPPPHPQRVMTRPAVATMVVTVRAVGGRAIRGRGMTWVRSFIGPSQKSAVWARARMRGEAEIELNSPGSSADLQVGVEGVRPCLRDEVTFDGALGSTRGVDAGPLAVVTGVTSRQDASRGSA